MATDETQPKQSNLKPWQPGQSGNPAGRPKGSRVKLGEQFLSDLLADWAEHGADAIRKMREEKAADYVKTVAATLPKELNVKVSELDELSDEQLARQLASLASQLARAGVDIGPGETPAIEARSLN
jgi:hypothetical protein